MANNTHAGSAPVGDEESGAGTAAPDRNFHRSSASPFGDPDQFLYGGGGRDSASSTEPTPPTDSQYEGRHRAAD